MLHGGVTTETYEHMYINHVNVDSHLARRKNVQNLVFLYLWKPSNGKLFSGFRAKVHLKCNGAKASVLK